MVSLTVVAVKSLIGQAFFLHSSSPECQLDVQEEEVSDLRGYEQSYQPSESHALAA